MAAAYQLLADGLQYMGPANARIPENQDIVGSFQEAVVEQRTYLSCRFRWKIHLGLVCSGSQTPFTLPPTIGCSSKGTRPEPTA